MRTAPNFWTRNEVCVDLLCAEGSLLRTRTFLWNKRGHRNRFNDNATSSCRMADRSKRTSVTVVIDVKLRTLKPRLSLQMRRSVRAFHWIIQEPETGSSCPCRKKIYLCATYTIFCCGCLPVRNCTTTYRRVLLLHALCHAVLLLMRTE